MFERNLFSSFVNAGNYNRVKEIISTSKGGIILKYERGSLKVFRLCQCRVFVAKYGSKDYKKVERSSSDSGPLPLEAFSFYKFVSGYQKNELSSYLTNIRFVF